MRTPLPAPPPSLPPEEAERLDALLREALDRQRRELAEATEAGLRFVPRLLRAPVRKLVGA